MPLKVFISLLSFILLISVLSCKKKESSKESISTQKHKHPYAKKKSFTYDLHGIALHDEYHWMEEKGNPEIRIYLEEENKYLDSMMQNTTELQLKIYNELMERSASHIKFLKKIDQNEYYSSQNLNQLYPVYYKTSGSNSAKDQILIDFNNFISEDQEFSIAFLEVSPDQQHFAFAIKNDWEDEYALIIKNINNNAISDTIPGVSHSAAWAEDSQTIFYTTKDETGRTDKVFNHKIYLPYEEDKLKFFEEDPDFNVSVEKPKNNQYILIQTESSSSSETHYLSADDPNQNFKLFSSRSPGLKYKVFPHVNNFFILEKDKNGNENKLYRATEGATESKNWQLAAIHNENHSIDDIDVFSSYLVLYKSEMGLPYIEIKDFIKNTTEQLRFEESTFSINPSVSSSFNDDVFKYEYESLFTPPTIFQVDYKTKQRKSVHFDNHHDFIKDSITSERIFVPSEEGIQIPVSLVYKKDLKKDGSAPLILYGYGAEENKPFPSKLSSMNFSNRISLLNRGYVFALAHVRGSKDLGADWNKMGKGQLKKNAINDYLKCAEFLTDQNYTSKEKLIAFGEAAGAVLAASAINVNPNLFKILVAKNPKTELLRLTENENKINFINEFGDPSEEDAYNYLLTYSPYDNIEVKAYPDFYIYSDFHNKETPYYHACKWAARLREYNTSQQILLLHTNFAPQMTVSEQLKNIALEYAFILEQTGYQAKSKSVAEIKP